MRLLGAAGEGGRGGEGREQFGEVAGDGAGAGGVFDRF